MINHCLSNCRKNYRYPLAWQQKRKTHACFQFSSILGSETRPLVATQREIRKHCWWLIRSWDSAKSSKSTSHWINQTSEMETVGSPSLSEEEQEKRPPMAWPLHKSPEQRVTVERETGKQQNSKICKYSLTCKEQLADPLISFPRWQHSFEAPNKAFHIRYKLLM